MLLLFSPFCFLEEARRRVVPVAKKICLYTQSGFPFQTARIWQIGFGCWVGCCTKKSKNSTAPGFALQQLVRDFSRVFDVHIPLLPHRLRGSSIISVRKLVTAQKFRQAIAEAQGSIEAFDVPVGQLANGWFFLQKGGGKTHEPPIKLTWLAGKSLFEDLKIGNTS